jgi:hypothetical protein
MKQLISCTRQRTCTSAVGSKKVPCQAQCDGFVVSTIFPGPVTARLFLFFPRLKSVLNGQRFENAEEGTANAMTALTEVSKNRFQECFQKLYEHWPKELNLREIMCKQM